MKISLNWVKQYVPLSEELSAKDLCHALTLSTVEVEGYEVLGDAFKEIVVGRIIGLRAHPNSDKLQIATTDIGESNNLDLVCGGDNLYIGMFVVVAKIGSIVKWHGKGEPITLKSSKIRGVLSEGMICSSPEIGLSKLFPASSESEVVDLTPLQDELKLELGVNIAKALELDDIVIDIDNKSLTNRPDLWGHYGIAREFAAIFKLPLRPLEEVYKPVTMGVSVDSSKINVVIETDDCFKYKAIRFDSPNNKTTPFWLKKKLNSVGQQSLELLVDLTNYVMLSVGQPTHVFDFDKLGSSTILIRSAREKEEINVLGGSTVDLKSNDIVITDSQVPIAVAGIIGGEYSKVENSSNKLVLEVANFSANSIRKTSTRVGLRTDSSIRYEKAIDTKRIDQAIQVFFSLLSNIQPEFSFVAVAEDVKGVTSKSIVKVSKSFIESRMGLAVETTEIIDILHRLGFEVTEKKGEFTVIAPEWRSTGDISIPEDIVEEVSRIIGYDNLPFRVPKVELKSSVSQPYFEKRLKLRRFLSSDASLHEVVSYPWVDDEIISLCENSISDASSYVKLHAPPTPSSSCLQQSLIPNLIKTVKVNHRNSNSFGIFEISSVFSSALNSKNEFNDEKLPNEHKSLGIAIVRLDDQDSYFHAKWVVSNLINRLGYRCEFELQDNGSNSWSQDGSLLNVIVNGENIGLLGLLSPYVSSKLSVKKVHTSLVEINIDKLFCISPERLLYKPLPIFPEVDFELSVIFDCDVKWSNIEKVVYDSNQTITNVNYLNEFQGEQIGDNKKSVSLNYTLYDQKGTLSSEKINEVNNKVVKDLELGLGGYLRS